MQDAAASAAVEDELAAAEQALQHLKHIGQALQEHLQHRSLAAHQRHAASADTGPGSAQHLQDETPCQHSDDEDTLLQACQYSSISPSYSCSTHGSLSGHVTSGQPTQQPPQPAAPAKQPPQWKQQVQQEKQMLQARQKQAAAEAAARSRHQLAQQQAASCQLAQQQLPFQVQHSTVSRGVTHKLQRSLSMILREAAARQSGRDHEGFVVPDPFVAGPVDPTPVAGRSRGALVSAPLAPAAPAAPAVQSVQQQPVSSPGPDTERLQLCSSPGASLSSSQGQEAVSPLHRSQDSLKGRVPPKACSLSSSRSRLDVGSSKQQSWATADAQTDMEVGSYLLEHWQQQHLATAALVLQCAWRSRAARRSFGRYMDKRRASVQAALQPALIQWHSWARACAHHRQYQQHAALQAWQELLQLQLQLCCKVLKGQRRGVLSGDTPALMMWRLCTSSLQQAMHVRPSLGGMLASILMHKIPRMRQQECLAAWQQLCRSQAALRDRAHKMLSAVLKAVQTQRLQQAVRFWRQYTACRICERLKLQLPALPQRCEVFDAWLWRHEQRQNLRQQAEGLAGRLSTLRCFVRWRGHVHKVCAMRAAWSGLLLHTPEELLRGGVSAFKANWREEQLLRRLLAAAVVAWKGLVDKNTAVAAVRRRIKDVAEARRKAAGLSAFRRFCQMSQLLSAAGVLKQWQARPLALAHIHAWLHDTLHATFYLCWWRWRRRAVARLRWRAALGLHMYRAHWLSMELAFAGWRKAAATAKQQEWHEQQQQPAQCQHEVSAAGGTHQDTEPTPATPRTPSALDSIASTGRRQQEQQDAPPAASDDTNTPDPAAPAEGSCQQLGGDVERDLVPEPTLPVSLADYPVGHPWRPLLLRRAVLAPQGLRRLTGLRLGRAVKDLRELEGSFILKDSSSGGAGLLCSRVFARSGLSPGLSAMATAQLPMNLLWRTSFPADKYWWQRVVGLVQQHVPHPDSWRALLTAPHSSTRGSPQADALQLELQDFLGPRFSAAAHKCTCSRCPAHATAQAAVVTEAAVKPTVDAAALMAKARLRLRAGLKLGLLQVPEGSTAASTAAPTPAAPAALTAATENGTQGASRMLDSTGSNLGGSSTGAQPVDDSSGTPGSRDGSSGGGDGSSSSSSGSDSSVWPASWTCEDVAGLCRLAQAEELLETAVHLLLGIGADSSDELYDKLQTMTRGQQLPNQGDLLNWLLSAALAQDSARNHAALAQARARDELLMATMELRERAMALHLHIPHKFTLNTKRERVDVRAGWADTISRVEQERDWDDSSAEEDAADPREQLWASLLLADSPPQQLWPRGGEQTGPDSTVPALPQQQEGRQLSWHGAQLGGGDGSVLPAGPGGAQAAVLALAAAAGGGRRLRPSAAHEPLAPGMMLSQTQAAAGAMYSPLHASRAHTPDLEARQLQQHRAKQQLDAQQQAALEQQHRQQEQARQKQRKQHKQAMAAANDLFGKRSTPAPGHGVGSSASRKSAATGSQLGPAAVAYGTMGVVDGDEEAEFFAGPGFLPLASLGGSHRSGASSNRSHGSTHRSSATEAAGAQGSNALLPQQLGGQPGTAEHPPAGGSSAARAAAAAVAVQLDDSLAQPSGLQHADAADGHSALKAELEGVLTGLLAPLLGPAAAAAAAAPPGDVSSPAGAAAGGVDQVPGVADAREPTASKAMPPEGAASAGSSGDLQCSRLAAECLAAACADWVLQQQPSQEQRSAAAPAAGKRLPAKPLSAPSALQAADKGDSLDRSSSGASGSTSSASLGSSGGRLPQHTPGRRAASAAGYLQACATDKRVAFDDAAGKGTVGQRAAGALASGSEEDAAACLDEGGGQGESWLALAVQQGWLPPALASQGAPGSQQQGGDQDSSPLDVGGHEEQQQQQQQQAGQPSSRELSSCSSLPSIPSAQGFWAAQQQGQQPRRLQSQARPAAGTDEGGCPQLLPPIAASARAGRHTQDGRLHKLRGLQQTPQQQQQQQQQQPACLQDSLVQQTLPQVAAALQDLYALEQQPGSTHQQLLQGLQQALSLLEPAQLQQQVELLLQAQRQSAAARLMAQQQEAVPIRPWEGELQPPQPDQGPAADAGADDAGIGSGAAVLSGLLTASLSTRVAFWRQVTAHHPQQERDGLSAVQPGGCGAPSSLSDQLHQLAWSSILLTRSAKHHSQGQGQHQQCPVPSSVGAAPMDALRERLRTYLAAHMQWRQQQESAPPLAPAEKWVTLEHEEQVLEFITSMTIAAHQQLLRKHAGLPAAGQPHAAAAFGSSSSRDSSQAAAARTAAAASSTGCCAAALAATGSSVDLSSARRVVPTVPRRAPARVVPVYVVPRVVQLDTARLPHSPRQHAAQLQRGLRSRLEPLQGWQTAEEDDSMSAGFAHPWPQSPTWQPQPEAAAVEAEGGCGGHRAGGSVTGSGEGAASSGPQPGVTGSGSSNPLQQLAGAGAQLGCSGRSSQSSESSWAG